MTTPTREELLELAPAMEATDEMIDAACNAVPDLYRVDAMKAIEAALSAFVPPVESELIEQAHQMIKAALPEDEPDEVPDWVCALLLRLGKSAALLQAQGEPVVWMREGAKDVLHNFLFDRPDGGPWVALYTAQQSSDQVWNEAMLAQWDAAYAAFKGAFDTPVARRNMTDEYSADARRRIRDFDDSINSLKRPSQAQDKTGCARSHPHENMSDECQRKAIEAREANRIRGEELRQQERNEPASVSGAVAKAKSTLRAIAETLDDVELRQAAREAYDELSRAQATQPAQQAPAVSDADRETVLGVIAWLKGAAQGDRPNTTRGEAADALQRLLSQPAAAPVSEQVTPEMIAAAEAVDDLYRMGQPQLWARVYRAMRSAAPSNQSQGGDKP